MKSSQYTQTDVEKSGIEQVRKWVEQDEERLRTHGDSWQMIGVFAEAEIQTSEDGSTWLINTIRSGGLWNTESDSDEQHFKEIEAEELENLKQVLLELGFSAEDIAAARVGRKSEF